MLERVLISLCKATERGGVEGILMTNTSQLITTNKTAVFPIMLWYLFNKYILFRRKDSHSDNEKLLLVMLTASFIIDNLRHLN